MSGSGSRAIHLDGSGSVDSPKSNIPDIVSFKTSLYDDKNVRLSETHPGSPSEQPTGIDIEARNTGTNLFVAGIHPHLTEDDVTGLFSKYGEVQTCDIMLDHHTKESRGFAFVNMATREQADAAKNGLQDKEIEGKALSIEKARRNRPRSSTPGKYLGHLAKIPKDKN